jgi:excinuclease ABC subunit C
VPGIGPTRRAALLKAFGSIEAIREAPAERVASLAGVPLTVAERVREYLAGAGSTPSDSGPTDPHEGGERRGVA